jgi:hypothetical protein
VRRADGRPRQAERRRHPRPARLLVADGAPRS